jgi:hypothetical protein
MGNTSFLPAWYNFSMCFVWAQNVLSHKMDRGCLFVVWDQEFEKQGWLVNSELCYLCGKC